MRAFGLLAGVGSLLREAQDAGFEVIGNLETRVTYHSGRHLSWDLNFPSTPLVRTPEGTDDWWHEADLAIGHPPCGSHSSLGRSSQSRDLSAESRVAMQARRDARSGLLPFFTEQVRRFRPRVFVLDNLSKILTTVAPLSWWRAELPSYQLTFITMNNWDYGTPQNRKRLWVVGVRGKRPFVFKPPNRRLRGPSTTLEALTGLSWEPWRDEPALGHVHVPPQDIITGFYPTTVDGLRVTRTDEVGIGFLSIPPGHMWPYRSTSGRLTHKIGRTRAFVDRKARVLTGLSTLHHPLTGWPLTARERARLMDWPDDFKLGDVSTTYDRRALMRLVQFTGKAVPSAFPRYLLPHLVRHLQRS